ncbi:hypothetical protein COEREDRAFT_83019 [Coemansia reversa NRRL 1564]|uniref:C2H2-type domain-containing protein n=1 Tax=Coemansia reversa (strain ATCC 12441 / NRRL 1564) TaxID=763665 RepID=A0A2G5B4Y7_COERN|nr:hypothetical protein COEREDRAFT_83019 [Coemansia reversa NRRL 1564]|eukprot:PIA14069.1 hypothetical protein COEREDRAFT_83019 [Coemansia reversa NRRL 1564]
MARLKEYLCCKKDSEQPLPAANFLDISIDDVVNTRQRVSGFDWLLSGQRTRANLFVRQRQQREQRQSRGISWLDTEWNIHDVMEESSNKCRHCNMRVSPMPSRMWHERVCELNTFVPAQCELCGREFYSVSHARNHIFYGCTPRD